MAINLATKYSKEIANAFTLRSVVDGTTNKDYDFTGVKTLNVYTPVTQSLADYQRTGTSRYGTPTELQDTMQELMLTRDRSFSITIDKGNNSEQMGAKEASRILSIEMNEQAIPEMDKYALGRFADYAGKIVALEAAPTSANIAEKLSDGMVAMSNKNVPAEGRFIFIGWSCFGAQQTAPGFSYTANTKKETISSTGADFILYTTDGTDPRYSSSAVKAVGGSATVDLSGFAGGSASIKAVAIKDGVFTSNLAAAEQAVAA